MSQRGTTSRALRRASGLILALAFLLAQLATQAHRAERAHVLCADHGRLEHGHGPDGHGPVHDDSAHGERLDATERSAAPEGDAHAACELAELLQASSTTAPGSALSVSAVPPAAAPRETHDEARPREVRGRSESARGPPRAA